MTQNLQSLTKDQLISHISKLEKDFQDFSQQSSQVEDLLQQQVDLYETQIDQKNSVISRIQGQLVDTQVLQQKVIFLETENDLLESTTRALRLQLESSIESHNECLEKIAFLENELELFKSSIMDENTATSTTAQSTEAENDPKANNFSFVNWNEKENELESKIRFFESQITQLTQENLLLEKKIKTNSTNRNINSSATATHTEKQFDELVQHSNQLVAKLRFCEDEKTSLAEQLKHLQVKYKKLRRLVNLVRLKQKGLVKAFPTPALTPLA